MRMHGPRGADGESEREQQHVVGVELERALPQACADAGGILHELADVEAAHQQRREKDKALRRGDETKGLIDENAEAGGQMRQRHPHQEETAQGIEFGQTLQFRQMHGENAPSAANAERYFPLDAVPGQGLRGDRQIVFRR